MAEPGFEARSFRRPSKYCNDSAAEAAVLPMWYCRWCFDVHAEWATPIITIINVLFVWHQSLDTEWINQRES